MKVKIAFLAHRIEFLDLLEKEIDECDSIILEEPSDLYLERFLNGDISVEEYVTYSDANFPRYMFHQAQLLKNLYMKGIKILQVEPYLEIIERIHMSIKVGKFKEYTSDPEVGRVLRTEKEAVGKLIEFQEELMRGKFDHVVEKVIQFAIKDSERFKLRDYMRAAAISKLEEDGRVLVEAGYLHVLLPVFLEKLNIEVETVNLVEEACRIINQEYCENPGDSLTKAFILNQTISGDARLLAAQSLVYTSLVSKDEKLPTPENLFPHLVEEINLAKKIRKMNYDECKREFQKLFRRNQS
ncbi:MAG: hypothetical protein QXW31_07485 [Nitrososphaerota archaeon]